MKIGDKVKIINIKGMWDKEIYYKGWGLTDRGTLIDYNVEVPEFDNLQYFENGDEAVIINSESEIIKDGCMLEIVLTDNNGNDFICHSQTYSLNELKSFCKL